MNQEPQILSFLIKREEKKKKNLVKNRFKWDSRVQVVNYLLLLRHSTTNTENKRRCACLTHRDSLEHGSEKVSSLQSFQVSSNYAIHRAYLDISVFQQPVKRSVLLIPAPCQTWLHLEWQSCRYSKWIFCPLSPSHILWKTTSIDFRVECIQFLFRFLYLLTFSISSHRVVSFVQQGTMTKWWIDGTILYISI